MTPANGQRPWTPPPARVTSRSTPPGLRRDSPARALMRAAHQSSSGRNEVEEGRDQRCGDQAIPAPRSGWAPCRGPSKASNSAEPVWFWRVTMKRPVSGPAVTAIARFFRSLALPPRCPARSDPGGAGSPHRFRCPRCPPGPSQSVDHGRREPASCSRHDRVPEPPRRHDPCPRGGQCRVRSGSPVRPVRFVRR